MGQRDNGRLVHADTTMTLYEAALISSETIQHNCVPVQYEARGLLFEEDMPTAGANKHRAVWLRDALKHCGAFTYIGNPHVIGNTVRAAMHTQTEEGMIPRRFADEANVTRNVKRILHLPNGKRKKRMWPEYRTAGGWFNGKPVNPQDIYFQTIVGAGKYVKATGHVEFAVDYMGELDKTLEHARQDSQNGLVKRRQHGCWNDHDPYEGLDADLSLDHLDAISHMADLKEACANIGPEYAYQSYALKAEAKMLRQTFNDSFWNDELGYYVKGLEPLRPQFSVAVNSKAILLGLADTDRAKRIVEKFREVYDSHGYMPIHTPGLSIWEMAPLRIPFAHQYITGRICLPWNQSLAAQAIAAVDPALAERVLMPIARSIVQHGNIEVLNHEYRPYSPIYMSGFEERFTWGALAYIEAAHAVAAVRQKDLQQRTNPVQIRAERKPIAMVRAA